MPKVGNALVVTLDGGYRLWWSTITPAVAGRLSVIELPKMFDGIDFRWRPIGGLGGGWDVWPIANLARPNPLSEVDRLSRQVRPGPRTLGVALISLQTDGDAATSPDTGWLWIELFLSETEPAQDGRTVFEDWVHILRETKDSETRQAVLTLDLGDVRPDELIGFADRKKLVTSRIELSVRPRAAQS